MVPPEVLCGDAGVRERIGFAEPILHAEGVAQWGARLATELCAKLEVEGLGARRIVFGQGRMLA